MSDDALQILFEKIEATNDYVRYRELVPHNEKPASSGFVRLEPRALRETFGHSAPPILKLTVEVA